MPKDNQKNINKICFVCEMPLPERAISMNYRVNLPVCTDCKETDKEKQAEKDLLESLADDFVCGCI